MSVIGGAETVAHAAVLSDRRAARGQVESLAVVDDRLYGVRSTGHLALTGRIVAAWALDWSDVPRSIVASPGNGAVAIRDEHGREFIVPIDDWWITPSSPTLLSTALDSSGLALLIQRYGASATLNGTPRPTVILPRPPAFFTRAELLVRVAVLGGGALIPLSVASALVVAATAHRLLWELWSLPQIAASIAVVVAAFSVIIGRRRITREPTDAVRPHGPAWFTSTASLSVNGGQQLELTDGQGMWRRLETPGSTLSPMAVSRVVFTDHARRTALLVDGTGTVRAELDAATWYPDGPDQLTALFNASGILTAHQPDVRSSPAQRLDTRSSLDIAKGSLSSGNELGVARVTPVLVATMLPVLGSATSFAAGLPWAGALCLALAATNVGLTCWLGWTETSVRVGDPTRVAVDKPNRMSGRSAALTIVVLASLLTLLWTVPAQRWDLVVAAVLLAMALPGLAWVAYRRRALINGSGPLALHRWWLSGASRGEES